MNARPLALVTTALVFGCTPSSEPEQAPTQEPPPAQLGVETPRPSAELAATTPPPVSAPDDDAPGIETTVEPDTPDAEGSTEPQPPPSPVERIEVELADANALKIEVRQMELWVSDGRHRAPLRHRATELHSVRTDTDATGELVLEVDFQDDIACAADRRHEQLPVRNLLARLANAGGMKSHRKGNHDAAAAAFMKATSLDPSFDLAWSNLACAEALRGRSAEAITALRPLLERRLLPTLHTLMLDSDLASIRDEPAFASQWSPEPGTVRLRGMTIAYSPHLNMVALRRHEDSWGSCSFTEDLRIHDATTGDLVTTLPLIEWGQTNPECDEDADPEIEPRHRAKVEARLDGTQAFLRRLGFSVSPALELVTVDDAHTATARFRARLPKSGLGMAMGDRRVRVLDGSEVLGTSEPLDVLSYTRAGYDPTAGVAFVQWHQDTAEGCADDREATGYAVIVVKAPRPPSPSAG